MGPSVRWVLEHHRVYALAAEPLSALRAPHGEGAGGTVT